MKHRILIIDVNAVLHSVKFSLAKHRLSHKEKPTFVIYGFLLKLQFLLQKTNANVVVYATDSNTSKRKEICSTYKEKRNKDKTDEQIALDEIAYPQFEQVIKDVVPTIGYRNVFGAEGFEADDIIGKICKTYHNDEIVICTTDQDMYQLLTNNVCMFDSRKNTWYTNTDFFKEYGIKPKMWKRVKAIGGCSSDNVKGVEVLPVDPTKKITHVAEKGALNYIKGEMGKNTRAYKAITSKRGRNRINRNKSLVILPFRGTPEFRIMPDRPTEQGMRRICEKYGFNSILEDMRSWRKILRLK